MLASWTTLFLTSLILLNYFFFDDLPVVHGIIFSTWQSILRWLWLTHLCPCKAIGPVTGMTRLRIGRHYHHQYQGFRTHLTYPCLHATFTVFDPVPLDWKYTWAENWQRWNSEEIHFRRCFKLKSHVVYLVSEEPFSLTWVFSSSKKKSLLYILN